MALLNFRFVNIAFICTSPVYVYHAIEVGEGTDIADNISQNENSLLLWQSIYLIMHLDL